ncbi:MAG: hypothetical protein H6678_02115 [Candidatus Delongbacteria bacterium]|nr:hypothetical protein [Candidatus Cloacimonadota bacterium]MCB9472586.1 hypothetical protein [Candidatus Delongbacteria bacterium]
MSHDPVLRLVPSLKRQFIWGCVQYVFVVLMMKVFVPPQFDVPLGLLALLFALAHFPRFLFAALTRDHVLCLPVEIRGDSLVVPGRRSPDPIPLERIDHERSSNRHIAEIFLGFWILKDAAGKRLTWLERWAFTKEELDRLMETIRSLQRTHDQQGAHDPEGLTDVST